ncbi:hypothetical protein ACJ41O_010121 [Fusarium nematophilum]
MSSPSDPFADPSDAALPNQARVNFNFPNPHPNPLASHPPLGPAPSFRGHATPTGGAGFGPGLAPGGTPQMNGDANSWVPSAHQAISNAIRVGGQATGGDNPMASGVQNNSSNVAMNGMVNGIPSNLANEFPDNMANGFPFGNMSTELVHGASHVANNGNGFGQGDANHGVPPGVSNNANNGLVHGTAPMSNGTAPGASNAVVLYPQPTQNGGVPTPAQTAFVSPPQGRVNTNRAGGHHHAYSGPATGLTHSHSYTGGLTMSQSYNTGLSFISQGPTPHHLGGQRSRGSYSSPEAPTHGRLSEPRNYAPRTSGQPVDSLPPPRFNLDIAIATAVPEDAAEDPFGSPARTDDSSSQLIPFPALPPPAVQQAMLTAPFQSTENKSPKLVELTCTLSGYPTLSIALSPNYFPFIDGPGSAKPATFGVVRLKNIPFSTKRSEIVAFIGRNSKMLNDTDEPVHIIMDRATSKTMDAFVEFHTMEDAMRCAERHHQFAQAGRVSRLGERPIEVELSSQATLMKELYPLARGVFWDGATPYIMPFNPDEPWANFKGFISCEEMVMLVKHVEVPHRSPFSKECPQRPYECLISTLRKFPWFSTNNITITQRLAMFRATAKLLRLLAKSVAQSDDPVNLNSQLFRRVVKTAMQCKGFTTMMKDDIAYMVHMNENEQRRHGQPPKPASWVHQYAVAPRPGIPHDVVDWYIRVIREQSTRDVLVRPISERTAIQEALKDTDDYWGYFFNEVGYTQGPQFDDMTLGQCAHAEFSALERILARALPN